MASITLQDIGEMKLIQDVILPLARRYDPTTAVGDDCTFIPTAGVHLAVTADAGPAPLIMRLPGHESDYESAGWLAAVATISDVASAGAQPLFLTNCIDAPPDLEVSHFQSYLEGYFRASAEFGFRNGGGDVRQGHTLAMRVFGVGSCEQPVPLGRGRAQPGDRLVGIGSMGEVMASFVTVLEDNDVPQERMRQLRFPRPQIREMAILSREGCLTAASDTSDGFLGAVQNIMVASQCGFSFTLNTGAISNAVQTAAEICNVSPWNIYFCWGDWSVAATVSASLFPQFEQTCAKNQITWVELGVVNAERGRATAVLDGRDSCELRLLRNENFRSLGYNSSVKNHIEHMLKTNIFI
ncbi:thiamine-phosphate kinase [Hyphomonas oceanitis]|uniref:AIR synthase domain-containing protein n=1 Tax=Hyphomonas oceanitis SCH89 TaxID=1280953 RepID=A0A059G6P5_9PROT|nr:AIR synthase related protein [Hyphomonas oceanitis]KDA02486.1 AIR synthase domain-containing protein [Hyphomonas oceanitis SCH89]